MCYFQIFQISQIWKWVKFGTQGHYCTWHIWGTFHLLEFKVSLGLLHALAIFQKNKNVIFNALILYNETWWNLRLRDMCTNKTYVGHLWACYVHSHLVVIWCNYNLLEIRSSKGFFFYTYDTFSNKPFIGVVSSLHKSYFLEFINFKFEK